MVGFDCAAWRAKKTGKKDRLLQDLNLRGQSPIDFESIALTARPNSLQMHHTVAFLILEGGHP